MMLYQDSYKNSETGKQYECPFWFKPRKYESGPEGTIGTHFYPWSKDGNDE
jgi:hypothetical protein